MEGQSPASKSWLYLGIPLRRSMHSQLYVFAGPGKIYKLRTRQLWAAWEAALHAWFLISAT